MSTNILHFKKELLFHLLTFNILCYTSKVTCRNSQKKIEKKCAKMLTMTTFKLIDKLRI